MTEKGATCFHLMNLGKLEKKNEFLLVVAILFVCFVLFVFLGLHPQHMEVPRWGVESELQLPAYTTTPEMHRILATFASYHSSWQRWIPNPLSKARNQTHILMETSQVH